MMKKDSLFWKKRHEKKNEEEYEELLNQKEFRGVIIDVFFSKNKWSSVKIELENGLKINAAGSLPNPLKGSEVKILGKVKKDPKYGYQLQIYYFQERLLHLSLLWIIHLKIQIPEYLFGIHT